MRKLLLAVAAIVVLLAGCGGVENEPNLAAAAAKTEATGSSAFALSVTQTLEGQLEEINCDGAADYAGKRMRLSCDEVGDFVAVGSAYYAQGWSSAVMGFPSDKHWVRIPIEEGENSPHDLAPGPLLAKLRAASLETTRLGEEDVRGETTVHYRMTVNCDEADLGCSGEATDVEVWIDGDGLVRRASFEDDGADITAEFFDFGMPVEVQEPPATDVVDVDNPTLEPCPGGGRPISDTRLRRALRDQGFDGADERGQCFVGVVAQLAAFVGSADDPDDGGAVVCYVYGSADPDAPAAVEETSRFGIRAFRLRNVHCSTFSSDRSDRVVADRLETALDHLARELRP